MKQQRQQGFSAIEGVLIAVIVLALAGVGYWVFSKQSDTEKDASETSQLSDGEAVVAPEVPAVENVSDLPAAEAALDAANLESGNSDNAELDAQSNGF